MTEAARWRRRPEGANWGDFGPDDQLGALNHIGRREVLAGIAEAREGLTFCLSLPLDYPGAPTTIRRPPVLRPTTRAGAPHFNFALGDHIDPALSDVISDDYAEICLQYSTQWDSLAHIGSRFDADQDGAAEIVYYNGYRAGEDIHYDPGDGRSQARALGIERMAVHGVQGRGVMIDLFAHYGLEKALIGFDEIQHVLSADSITVQTGDILCFHTGIGEEIMRLAGSADAADLAGKGAALDGRDERLLRWITDTQVAALAADNQGVEAYPYPPSATPLAEPRPQMPLHEYCIFKNGIPLGEFWRLTELANWLRANGRSAFLLTAPPLRLTGAVGSPVTPLATV